VGEDYSPRAAQAREPTGITGGKGGPLDIPSVWRDRKDRTPRRLQPDRWDEKRSITVVSTGKTAPQIARTMANVIWEIGDCASSRPGARETSA